MNDSIEPYDASEPDDPNGSGDVQRYSAVVAAADDAIDHLRAAQKQLDQAYNWGVYDMYMGGMIGSLIKYYKLQKAQREIEGAKQAVLSFVENLRVSNLDASAGLRIDIDDFLSFADIFLDNAFVDLMVQMRILEAQKQVSQALQQIELIRDQLC